MENVFVQVLSLLLIIAQIECDECPKIYQRFSESHSYCQKRNPRCNVLEAFPKNDEIEIILSLHNSFRSVLATEANNDLPTAANMLQLEWDSELAAVAQKYADRCIYAHDCPNCRRVLNFGVGQNIAYQKLTGDNIQPPKPDWNFAVSEWYEEIVSFNKHMVCPFPQYTGGGEFRHFSQLVWGGTFRIGCGYVMYKEGNSFIRMYICNYGPAGNVYDTCVYKPGPPCSQCPVNSCCGESCMATGPTYPGLCKRINEQPPLYPPKQPTLFYCDFQNPNQEDCLINTEGSNGWYIMQALEGYYLEAVLRGGQNSTLTFSKTIQPHTKQFCVQLVFRKGPDLAINPEINSASETFEVPTLHYTYSQSLPSYPMPTMLQFSTYNMTLQWDEETLMKLSFVVPFGAKDQFINLHSIMAVDNACEN